MILVKPKLYITGSSLDFNIVTVIFLLFLQQFAIFLLSILLESQWNNYLLDYLVYLKLRVLLSFCTDIFYWNILLNYLASLTLRVLQLHMVKLQEIRNEK